MRMKVLAVALSLSIMFSTIPFTFAEVVAARPLGSIATNGSVRIGTISAPTGSTVFAGDQVSSNGPALISLMNGSRIEMTKASATFNRRGDTLVVKTDHGLLKFNFDKGEKVLIEAGKYQITGSKDSKHIGVLGLNKEGEIAVGLSEGTLIALNVASGVRTEISPNVPMVVQNQSFPKPQPQGTSGAGGGGSAGGVVTGGAGTGGAGTGSKGAAAGAGAGSKGAAAGLSAGTIAGIAAGVAAVGAGVAAAVGGGAGGIAPTKSGFN
jgi:hypothetical protein